MAGSIKLETPLSEIRNIGPKFLKRLEKLRLRTVRDLLWHFPARYEDFSQISKIADLEAGQRTTIQGKIEEIGLRHTWRRRISIVEAVVADETASIKIIWFNQPYIAGILRPGKVANFAGRISLSEEGELYLSHPAYELITRTHADSMQTNTANSPRQSASRSASVRETKHTARLVPIYPETKGLTSKGLRFLIQPLLSNIEFQKEWLPYEVLKEENLPEVNAALRKIHFPAKIEEALVARKRFAFEDLFLLQIFNLKQKASLAEERAPVIKSDISKIKNFLTKLPFELTLSQKKSLWEIIKDLEKPHPMNRLLQGDVGSGKTVVAALSAWIAAQNGYQTAFMAPTEILARQHFLTLQNLFSKISAEDQPKLGLLTSSEARIVHENDLEAKIKKSEFIKLTSLGEIKIVIGTHAIIQKSVNFNKLGLVIIDEQHRFGVSQRAALVRGQTQTNTQTNADNLLYEDITYKIRGCLINVKNKIGTNHRESIYQKALAEELKITGLRFRQEKIIDIKYNGRKIGMYKPDFIIDDKIIVELKALPFISAAEERQLWKYLRESKYKLALLANFSGHGVEIKRIVYEAARTSPRGSASLVPHFLSMSATPIPRTLMLTVFGDLDISIITELPAGRKNIVTRAVYPENRNKTYGSIREEVKRGRQVFVVCPRIEPYKEQNNNRALPADFSKLTYLEKLKFELKSVKEEYEKLKKNVFPDLKVAMLHGQMKSKEKEKIMDGFRNGRIDILVSTSVIEVGVDIPNATIMMIEGVERFGLAQLYQFRGRVGRGHDQSYCFLFTDSDSASTKARLKAILQAKNGLELAEYDLKIRGPGEFLGESQTGMPDYAMQALQDIELVKSSREAAQGVIRADPAVARYPLLRAKLEAFEKQVHLE